MPVNADLLRATPRRSLTAVVSRLNGSAFIQESCGHRISLMVTLAPVKAIGLGSTIDGHGHCRLFRRTMR
jgi:hypothetical protein